jgi:hypothetical protein
LVASYGMDHQFGALLSDKKCIIQSLISSLN